MHAQKTTWSTNHPIPTTGPLGYDARLGGDRPVRHHSLTTQGKLGHACNGPARTESWTTWIDSRSSVGRKTEPKELAPRDSAETTKPVSPPSGLHEDQSKMALDPRQSRYPLCYSMEQTIRTPKLSDLYVTCMASF